MFCRNCGKQLSDTAMFCDACGTKTAAENTNHYGSSYTGAQHQKGESDQPFGSDGYRGDPYYASMPTALDSTAKTIAAFAYVGFLFFLPLVVQPVTPYGKFHANQGLTLLIANLVALAVLTIFTVIVAVISLFAWFGWIILILLWLAYFTGFLVLTVMGIVNGASGNMTPLPLIGKLFTFIR